MRVIIVFSVAAVLASAQPRDAAFQVLDRAYLALRDRDYDTAVPAFLDAIQAAPARADIRKDLAYTYLKIGERELARDQFREAFRLDPTDDSAAMEFAYLCYETKQQAEARRVFDTLRRKGNAAAEQAFHNVDDPLAEGIGRWRKALAIGGDNFSGHFELATLAEQRGELPLAAEHFEKAWRLLPDRRSVLVDLGRVWQAMERQEDAGAALLAASRGGEPRAAEMARELLPSHYPFVNEFRKALALDPPNHELRRELGFLLLKMGHEAEAEAEFRILTQDVPDDLLSATQLGFLLYSRGDKLAATPLFDRVLDGQDDDLANRVRAVLRIPQILKPHAGGGPQSIDAKIMAERSIKAGYIKDALKYLELAHETDPGDFDIMRKLASMNNILHRDAVASRWFDLARRSPDPTIAAESDQSYRNLRGALQRFRTTAWMFPMFSSRWHDTFAYAQIKTEINLGFPVRPYVSVRFVGDVRGSTPMSGAAGPQYLSESSLILGFGTATTAWHGFTAWAEAGTAVGYRSGHMLPDYRGGVSLASSLRTEGGRWLADGTVDALYVSRFDHDFLVYAQGRAGYKAGPVQFHWNANATVDARREDWANFIETGPGIRIPMAQSMYMTFNLLRGAYLIQNPSRRSTFNDLRAGLWYAFTR